MPGSDEYKVQLEVFEGPLDLLLYLIKRDELDIYDIPIERITQQYMQYLDVMKMLDLSIAGEFLVMAATLMMIKSRMLLPVEDRPELEAEEDDPRWDLVRQLVEYKKFKDAADHLEIWLCAGRTCSSGKAITWSWVRTPRWRCTMSASLT
jgi:segregation and condensation protein A